MAVGFIPEDYMHCNSKDEKPKKNIEDGQCMIEKDTGNVFIFDIESMEWYPL